MNFDVTDPRYIAKVIRLKDLDAQDGRPGCGFDMAGNLCSRCRGKGWLQFKDFGTRWSCPDCLLAEGDVS